MLETSHEGADRVLRISQFLLPPPAQYGSAIEILSCFGGTGHLFSLKKPALTAKTTILLFWLPFM